jgi:hypothetical protein
MSDARAQEARVSDQLFQDGGEMKVELVDVVGARVGERPFGDRPDAFVGIQLRGVGREPLEPQAWKRAAEVAQRIALVDVAVVPDDDQVAAEMP